MRPELGKEKLEKIKAVIIEPRMAAQLEAKKAYAHFIAWSKIAFYWIVAVLIILAFSALGQMEQAANATVKFMHR